MMETWKQKINHVFKRNKTWIPTEKSDGEKLTCLPGDKLTCTKGHVIGRARYPIYGLPMLIDFMLPPVHEGSPIVGTCQCGAYFKNPDTHSYYVEGRWL